MKKKLFIILFFIFSTITSFASSEYPNIDLLRSDEDGLIFQYNVPQFTTHQIKTDTKNYDLIRIPNCAQTESTGKPQLPQRIVILGIPKGCEIKAFVLDYRYEEISYLFIAPFPDIHPDLDEIGVPDFLEDQKTYTKDEFYPEDIVSLETPFWIRDQRVVRIKINPVQFNPQRKKIKFYESITLAFEFLGEKDFGKNSIQKDPFEKIYKTILLNYEKAKTFRKRREKTPLFKAFGESPFSFSNFWYKIQVENEGIYKIARSDLKNAGVDVDGINPKTIRIFNGGGKELPLDNSQPRPKLKELSIKVFGEEDEKFDPGDYILFYGWGVNDWEYDTSKNECQHYINHYTDKNIFWLTFSGSFPDSAKRMNGKDDSLIQADFHVPHAFKDYVFQEKEKELCVTGEEIHDYFNWYESKGNYFSQSLTLTNVEVGEDAIIKVKTKNASLENIKVNGTDASLLGSTDGITHAVSDRIREGENRIDFEFGHSVYFDWYEVGYMKKFRAENNKLLFESPDTSGFIQYQISDVTSSAFLFEIKDRFEPQEIVGFQLENDTLKFQDELKNRSKKRYYLLSEDNFIQPKSITIDSKSNLRDPSNQADILVITHPDFYQYFSEYEIFREEKGSEVEIIDVFDIYDEFSWGLYDPIAIRDFLKFSFYHWKPPKPSFVLLVGDGNYDYKYNLGVSPSCKIPPFTAYFPVSDDNFVYFGPPGDLDPDSEGEVNMIIGRFPAKAGFEVKAFVDKILEYEKNPVFGRWRNTITLVADDFKGRYEAEYFHTVDTETLSIYHVPNFFNVNKIYLLDFPSDVNHNKPEAGDAIVETINNGTVLLNWMGHGNTQQWAHEEVFKRTEDIPRLENKGIYPLIFAATCSNGLFFNPSKECMAEDLVRAESKGAVGVISSTGMVRATQNAELNYTFYDYLLRSEMTIGEALFSAKLSRKSDNDRYYVLLGDPFTRLASPRLKVKIKDLKPDTLSFIVLIAVVLS